ncbi:twin-arginine translocase subunit TatC [Actinomadura rayongensis]|uniref:Sec-independent protein translocase protein TatC n=1 Tax=Actinomadura rayongensis TaxID=1429076 RepID=A0A6I4WAA5_9ACTN|nr:twin-arginine translocase subunit TatC [Actinomadura rayongensis]MXQ67799.1 twin-arginine translocase subunit TatC [Actinomadura rayongensis]
MLKLTTRRDVDPEGRMPLMEHLRELRNRLVKAILALAAGAVVAWLFFDPIWDFVKEPYTKVPAEHCINRHCDLVVHGPFDGFFIHLKVALMVGAVLSSPVWLYQLWAFVAPGLYRRERRWTYTFMAAAIPLFLVGAGLAYVTMDKGLRLLVGLAPGDTLVLIGIQDYLSYAQAMLLIFGLTFELPLFVVILNLAGVLRFRTLMRTQRFTIFGLFVFAAVATPSADPFTMLALALPTVLLYEVAVLLTYFNDRRRDRRPDPYDGLSDDEASPLELD